jgi:hypothetical protein
MYLRNFARPASDFTSMASPRCRMRIVLRTGSSSTYKFCEKRLTSSNLSRAAGSSAGSAGLRTAATKKGRQTLGFTAVLLNMVNVSNGSGSRECWTNVLQPQTFPSPSGRMKSVLYSSENGVASIARGMAVAGK